MEVVAPTLLFLTQTRFESFRGRLNKDFYTCNFKVWIVRELVFTVIGKVCMAQPIYYVIRPSTCVKGFIKLVQNLMLIQLTN
jgi:hypothetical protein